jgi:hypothetical protein
MCTSKCLCPDLPGTAKTCPELPGLAWNCQKSKYYPSVANKWPSVSKMEEKRPETGLKPKSPVLCEVRSCIAVPASVNKHKFSGSV